MSVIMGFTKNDTKIIKGIAIILMLYHHLFFFPDRISDEIVYLPIIKIGGTSLAYFIGEFGNICVSVYLFLGGYGTYISCGKSNRIGTCVLNKIKNLYVEYWKIFIIFVPICMIAGVDRVENNLGIFILNFTGLYISYCGEWWFITPYITLLVLFPAMYKILSKKNNLITDFSYILTFAFLVMLFYLLGPMDVFNKDTLYTNPCSTVMWNIFSLTLGCAMFFYLGCIFAKYDLLAKLKNFFIKNYLNTFGALMMLGFMFYLRHQTGSSIDFIFVPVFVAAIVAIITKVPVGFLRNLFMKIGSESTTIWLVHSVYCYLLCQKLVFAPKYTVLIFSWLLIMSYYTSIVVRKIFSLVRPCKRVEVKQ